MGKNMMARIWFVLAVSVTFYAYGQGARTSFPLYEKGITNYHEGTLYATNANGRIYVRNGSSAWEAVNYQQLTSAVATATDTYMPTNAAAGLPFKVGTEVRIGTNVSVVAAGNGYINSLGTVGGFQIIVTNGLVESMTYSPVVFTGSNTGLVDSTIWSLNPSLVVRTNVPSASTNALPNLNGYYISADTSYIYFGARNVGGTGTNWIRSSASGW